MTAMTTSAAKVPRKRRNGSKKWDKSLDWIAREHPNYVAWQPLAAAWIASSTTGVHAKQQALSVFVGRYLVGQSLPHDPAILLARHAALPDFYETSCPQSRTGMRYANDISSFIDYVLLREFSDVDDHGLPIASPAFRNPVARRDGSGLPRRDESIHSPLPYGYLDELRGLIAQGPNFGDWCWAHTALQQGGSRNGAHLMDWFVAPPSLVDKSDPDCVWREREVDGVVRTEMWSPVRWVALLVKLIVPLRTFQVRMLDSGEADTWRFANGSWVSNASPLAEGTIRRPLQQGVFRRGHPSASGEAPGLLMYINTNKTADAKVSGPEKGYEIPWPPGGEMHQDAFLWLEKLRNWQEKYNPISRRTPWTELDSRHMPPKSDVQMASYPPACFLFRMGEGTSGDSHLPLKQYTLDNAWYRLLSAYEDKLWARDERHNNGARIRFLPSAEDEATGFTTLFPLHSLRVSLITALALEGSVPFAILQKVVGHSRLLMTLYYNKPGHTFIQGQLRDAAARLEAKKDQAIQRFLLDTERDELIEKAICNNSLSLAAVIPVHPASRTQLGWMPMHHGLCLVGGNTTPAESSITVGGCYNGGPVIHKGSSSSQTKYGPVPGGSRNCVRCRWFVTEPHFLPALAAHFNTLAYHFNEARDASIAKEQVLQAMKRLRLDAEDAGVPFTALAELKRAERVWEGAMQRFSDLAEDLVACWRLIERCRARLSSDAGGAQLVAAGTALDVQVAFDESSSELLQLAGVCEDAEIYPDLQPGKAIFRRSQILDALFARDNKQAFFMLLSEEDQLKAGNAFLRNLAQRQNPANPALGKVEVIRMIDAGESLSQHFKIDLASLTATDGSIGSTRELLLEASGESQ